MQAFQRNIDRTWEVAVSPGSGTHVQVGHVLPPGNWEAFDPFLMMAEDWFRQGTFDFHPHRGIETVTYVIEGKLKHEDNYGGYGVLEPGDVQWMTAGRGIVHSEDPLPGETVHSLQLWVNLPKSHKMAEPRYQDLHAAAAPVRHEDGAEVRVYSGASGEARAETMNHHPVTFLDIRLEPGAAFAQELPAGYNGFVYVLQGSGRIGANDAPANERHVLWTNPVEGAERTELAIRCDTAMRLILAAGEPLREKVVAYGPFVMNSEGEVKQAFIDYQEGRFGPVIRRR